MHDNKFAQARELYATVNLLKRKMTRHFAQNLKSREGGIPCADMTFPQSNAMIVIRERGALSVKELAEVLQVSPPSASAMVDRLVEMNMLVREQSQEDRRGVTIRISEYGATCLEEVENQILTAIVGLLEKLGPEVSQQWCHVYARVHQVLEQEIEQTCPEHEAKE